MIKRVCLRWLHNTLILLLIFSAAANPVRAQLPLNGPPSTESPDDTDGSLPAATSIPSATNPAGPDSASKKAVITAPHDATFDFWSHVPPLRPMSRTGHFLIRPTGFGYYTFLEMLLNEPRPNRPKLLSPPASSDRYSFYDADYREHVHPVRGMEDIFYPLKRLHPTDQWLLAIGGEERVRYMDENGGYARFTGKVNTYELTRSRVFTDLWYLDRFRIYGEMQDSRIANNDLPPLRNDVDHADFLNLFVDAKLFSLGEQPAYVRVGRQEMYLGSQRLISPSSFPNVRRTFQGVRAFWLGKDWNVDAFFVEPVLMRPTSLDPPDHNRQFSGLWLIQRPRKGQEVNLYYLNLNNATPNIALGSDGVMGGYNVSTVGARYTGDFQQFLWDFEGMYQFGSWANQTISAEALTAGVGYQFAKTPFNPQFWLLYDFASGDHHPGAGNTHGTFNQLFPWGHTYFGYLDLVGRQNIHDLNMQFGFFPMKWISATCQYHIFHLDSARDALYNASGVPIRSDPTGQAGTFVGDELDLTMHFHFTLHQDLFVGYSKLFPGSFIRQSSGPQLGPGLFYCQYSFRW